MNYQDITIEPSKRGGRPTIRGMRIAVADVLGWLAEGMTHEEIISDYPELTEEDIRALPTPLNLQLSLSNVGWSV